MLCDTQGKNKYVVAALIDVMPNIMKTVMDSHITVSNDKSHAQAFTVSNFGVQFELNTRIGSIQVDYVSTRLKDM